MSHAPLPPLLPDPSAPPERLAAFLADFIEWLLKHRLDRLKSALSEADLFRLRRAAHAYRNSKVTSQDYATMQTLFDALDDG